MPRSHRVDFDSTAVHGALVAAAEMSSDGLMLTDSAGAVRYINSAALAMLGLEDQQAAEETSTFALVRESSLSRIGRIKTAVDATGSWHGPIDITNVRGDAMTLDLSIYILAPASGTEASTAILLRDLRPTSHHERDLKDAMDAVASRAREQQVISDLNRIALKGQLDELAAAAVQALVDVLEVEHAAVFRPATSGVGGPSTHGGDYGPLRLIAGIGPHRQALTAADVRPGSSSLAGYAIQTRTIAECPDIEVETRFDPTMMVKLSLRSGLAVPVLSGDTVWGVLVAYRAQPHRVSEQAVTFVAMVVEVISAALRRADLERELLYQSLHDPLTHLANRTLAYRRIDTALARSRSDSVLTAVMLVDLHDFRTINDSLGHGAGDAVLAAVAPMLTEVVRPGDTVARFGGDEFLVICSDLTDSFGAMAIAQKILARFRRPISINGRPVEVSGCIGVAVGHGDDTAAEMVRHADIAVGEAKKEGPGTVHVFDYEKGGAALRRLTIASALRAALDNDALSLAYQPVFELSTGRLQAVEALARWDDSTVESSGQAGGRSESGGQAGGRSESIGPAEFVPIAERAGLIVPLGEWALRTACAAAARWQESVPVALRVNVSPLQLRYPGFAATVARTLSESGLPAAKLGIEITESIWVEDTATVRRNLAALHEMGVSILLDDFGVGHSSLNYLKRFPILDCIKIDRSFVADLPGAQAEAIVGAIVSIARAFDLVVVGEGVETLEQLDSLRRSGCDLGQGFLLAKPVSEAEVPLWFDSAGADGDATLFA